MAHIVGIDLGTTNSLVAHLDAGTPRLVPNRAGQSSTPSIVGLDPRDRLHVGATAKNQLVALPDRTVAEVKRLMGTSERVLLGPRTYTATEVSGIILRALKEDAERFLGDAVDEAVVTVPAYFTDAQRKATKDAGELAGLRVERILNEPTAAALAYGLDNLDKEQLVLVYDLGGGTFDVSVLEMFDGVLEVKASAGNNRLGGGDFDRAIVAWLVAAFERAHGVDLRPDLRAMARLRAAAEQAKIELTLLESTTITLPFLAARAGEPLSFEIELSRAEMERLLLDLVRQTLPPMESALADARVDRKQIAEVVLVGGASRMPMVERLVAEFFGKPARRGVNPDEAVALGAAVQAGLKTGAIASDAGIMITDVCPFTLGVEVRSSAGSQHVEGLFSPIIPRNSTVPISRTEVYATTTDRQAKVDIRVFQGESRLVKNNVFLDAYSVDGVPPGPAGTEKVAVTFTYDVNGILAVTTKVVSTGKEATLRVDKSPQRMSDKAREEARERIEREWTGTAAGSAAPAPARSVATASVAASPASPASPAPPGAGSPSPSSSEPGLGALVAAARARASSAPEDTAMRLRALATEAETALARGDRAAIARLDVALTELLFDLS